MLDRIFLEKLFDNYFEAAGFQRVTPLIGESPDFDNADYIDFPNLIIAELKIIEKDYFKDGGIIDRLNSFIPVSNPKLPYGRRLPPGQYYINFPGLNREGKSDTFEEPLRRVLKKANRQIKETKEKLFVDKAYGFVFLAINMHTLIDIELISALAQQLLVNEFSSIDGFIVGAPVLAFNGYDPCCIHVVRAGVSEQFENICDSLGDYFADYFFDAAQVSQQIK